MANFVQIFPIALFVGIGKPIVKEFEEFKYNYISIDGMFFENIKDHFCVMLLLGSFQKIIANRLHKKLFAFALQTIAATNKSPL